MASPTSTTSDSASLTRKVIGPLTTVFTPPANCGTCVWGGRAAAYSGEPYYGACLAYNYGGLCVVTDEVCLPSITSEAQLLTPAFYSPAVYCPSGWTIDTQVSANTDNPNFAGSIISTLIADETAAICCPSGYTFFSPSSCATQVQYTSFTYLSCAWPSCDSTECPVTTVTATAIGQPIVDGWGETVNFTSIEVFAPTIQINWRPVDRENYPVTTDAGTTGATVSATGASTSDGAVGSQQGSGSSGLSTAAGIGLGIGVAAAAVLLGIAVFILLRRRKRRASRRRGSTDGSATTGKSADELGGKPELEGTVGDPDAKFAWHKAELHNADFMPELEGDMGFELEGTTAKASPDHAGELAVKEPAATEVSALRLSRHLAALPPIDSGAVRGDERGGGAPGEACLSPLTPGSTTPAHSANPVSPLETPTGSRRGRL